MRAKLLYNRYAAFECGAFDVVEKNIRGTSAVREINVKTRAALRYRKWWQQLNFMRQYFGPKVFDVIERDPSLLSVSQRTVTIVFWNIRGFSKLCDILKAHPTLISGFLKEYCELGARVIFDHNGVLDKFIGDGIMAIFGVINHRDDNGTADAISAVKAATEFRRKFPDVLERWSEEWSLYVADRIDIGLGCGIHTGEATVGNVGTDFRNQFTALGPNVNFASRIESECDSGQILVSSTIEARVRSNFSLAHVKDIDNVKNIPGTFSVYTVHGEHHT
ncbi:adenylate/guanylate cyclase domain-containing protein [Candidatus Magnetobacterium casense]|uniref:Adenylate/guanylate cyclase domain-containing protein n=1 Tax=Candidatus Magnetobacterium casense TaxID=1455061 RepID=A0ABS6RUJ5_9BACT|nr:adenylate/guanylate cyclase domain-containing protein [Candidatus Magnetobacterium casensis]MBV6340309.1 adenylate/guanylate cyclase domain-containing protein [Candidatus Magnetobacterium casensis]